jgi:hypothetical protein
MVSHPSFKALLQLLRPGVKVPSRKRVAGALLEDVHQATIAQIKAWAAGQFC